MTTTTETTDLSAYKKLKKAEVLAKDLAAILKLTTATKGVLLRYSHYTPVRDILTQINTSNQMLEIFLEKYERVIQNKGNDP